MKQLKLQSNPVAIKAFLRVAATWKLRNDDTRQLLGGISYGTFYRLKRGESTKLNQDKLTRISLLIGIFKALNILYSKSLADKWVTLPNNNSLFSGSTPLIYMIKGGMPGLVRVRQLLDAQRI